MADRMAPASEPDAESVAICRQRAIIDAMVSVACVVVALGIMLPDYSVSVGGVVIFSAMLAIGVVFGLSAARRVEGWIRVVAGLSATVHGFVIALLVYASA